jgi:hypothetical protein
MSISVAVPHDMDCKDTVSVTRHGTESRAFAHLERITPAAMNLTGVCAAVLDREAAEEAAERRWLDQQCSTGPARLQGNAA